MQIKLILNYMKGITRGLILKEREKLNSEMAYLLSLNIDLKIILNGKGGGGGGGGRGWYLVQCFAGYAQLASQNPYPL